MKKSFTLTLILMAFFCVQAIQAADFGGVVSANTTLTLANSPYIITSNVTVNAGVTLTIESGVEIRMGSNMYFHVVGTLNATGVTFTANTATPTPGFYDGIYVSYQSYVDVGTINLNGCTVEYAKQLYVRNGALNLSNCTLKNFSDYGVDIYSKGTLNIVNTTITGTTYPIYFRDTNGGNFTSGGGNVLTGNTNDFIYINFRDIDEPFRMYDMGIPYYSSSEMRITETGHLFIDPGVQVQSNTGGYISVNGRISAKGSKNKPILFTTRTGNAYWQGIKVNNAAIDVDCVFRNCVIENATYNYQLYSALSISDASPTVDSCFFRNNTYNLQILGRSLPSFSNNSFGASIQAGASAYNINMDLNAEPNFTNDSLRFNNTEARAIGILGNKVVNNARLKKLNFVGIQNITYLLLGDVTIDKTAALNIDAGIVIKTNDNSYDLIAEGPLTGIGTAQSPIVFTHQADDNYGNPTDTYNNGSGSVIGHSNAGRIILNSTALSTLQHWNIRYAGYSSGYYGVYLRNNNVLSNSTISSSYRGVYFAENAQIINNAFVDIDYYPVTRYINKGTPVLISNTLSNANTNGINIDGFATDTVTLAPMDFAGYSKVAYIIESDKAIPKDAIVNVAPGTVFKFNSYATLNVNGGLSAIGTASNKIVFTSIHDDSAAGDTNLNGTSSAPAAGNWYGINFNNISLDNINKLTFCDIRYLYYGLTISDCFVDMQSSTLNFSSTNGLLIYGSANPNVANNQFYNLGAEPIHMDMFASPVFSGNTVANVPRLGISLRGQTVSGTVPVRGFAGIDTITYVLNENMTINDHLIIPAGLTFKSNGDRRWYVNGRLDVQGTAAAPVVFTSYQDDAYGKPADLEGNGQGTQYERGSHIYFYDSSNDNSTINYAIFRYSEDNAIKCFNASPIIRNTRFEAFNNNGVLLSGLSNPTVVNCTFKNIAYPLATSLTSFPGTQSGNIISGTTGRGIRIIDETQTQDVTVSKKSFAGIANIPYIMGTYTIGTGSVVSVQPGVVFKFLQNGSLNVYKGLLALGNAGEKVVFTASTDDFYGGDTYNDGDAYLPNRWHWYGIHFYNEAIDAQCQMEHCIIKNASYNAGSSSWGAVTVNNSSPSIKNCLFDNNLYGIVSRNTSQPVITNCDFINFETNSGYSIYNLTTTNNITASNCWWGDASGPYHATKNPTGSGKVVSDGVTFNPWNSILGSPILGDVSLNGEIKPYDASLVLQHTVSNIVLTPTQQGVADVSKDATISSYDASLILQYSIGLITDFNNVPPPAAGLKSKKANGLNITANDVQVTSSVFDVTLQLTTSMEDNIKGVDIKLASNPLHIKLISVEGLELPAGSMMANGYNSTTGEISLSLASAHNLNLDKTGVTLKFEMLNSNIPSSVVELTKASANETSANIPLDIEIISPITTSLDLPQGLDKLNMWHSNNVLYLDIASANVLPRSTLTVTDLSGSNIYQIVIENVESGLHSFDLPINSSEGGFGIYLITIRNNEFTLTKKISVR